MVKNYGRDLGDAVAGRGHWQDLARTQFFAIRTSHAANNMYVMLASLQTHARDKENESRGN